MKNMRRGLGKGLGMGYKNLVPIDSHIHSLSAKGVKIYPDMYAQKNRFEDKEIAKHKQIIEEGMKRRGEWSFDLTDFTSKDAWKMFLEKNKFVLVGKMKNSRVGYSHFQYENPQGIKILTQYNPLKEEEAFLGYVGMTYPKTKEKEFMEVLKDFRKGAGYIKEENPNEQNYISNEWLYLNAKGKSIVGFKGNL